MSTIKSGSHKFLVVCFSFLISFHSSPSAVALTQPPASDHLVPGGEIEKPWSPETTHPPASEELPSGSLGNDAPLQSPESSGEIVRANPLGSEPWREGESVENNVMPDYGPYRGERAIGSLQGIVFDETYKFLDASRVHPHLGEKIVSTIGIVWDKKHPDTGTLYITAPGSGVGNEGYVSPANGPYYFYKIENIHRGSGKYFFTMGEDEEFVGIYWDKEYKEGVLNFDFSVTTEKYAGSSEKVSIREKWSVQSFLMSGGVLSSPSPSSSPVIRAPGQLSNPGVNAASLGSAAKPSYELLNKQPAAGNLTYNEQLKSQGMNASLLNTSLRGSPYSAALTNANYAKSQRIDATTQEQILTPIPVTPPTSTSIYYSGLGLLSSEWSIEEMNLVDGKKERVVIQILNNFYDMSGGSTKVEWGYGSKGGMANGVNLYNLISTRTVLEIRQPDRGFARLEYSQSGFYDFMIKNSGDLHLYNVPRLETAATRTKNFRDDDTSDVAVGDRPSDHYYNSWYPQSYSNGNAGLSVTDAKGGSVLPYESYFGNFKLNELKWEKGSGILTAMGGSLYGRQEIDPSLGVKDVFRSAPDFYLWRDTDRRSIVVVENRSYIKQGKEIEFRYQLSADTWLDIHRDSVTGKDVIRIERESADGTKIVLKTYRGDLISVFNGKVILGVLEEKAGILSGESDFEARAVVRFLGGAAYLYDVKNWKWMGTEFQIQTERWVSGKDVRSIYPMYKTFVSEKKTEKLIQGEILEQGSLWQAIHLSPVSSGQIERWPISGNVIQNKTVSYVEENGEKVTRTIWTLLQGNQSVVLEQELYASGRVRSYVTAAKRIAGRDLKRFEVMDLEMQKDPRGLILSLGAKTPAGVFFRILIDYLRPAITFKPPLK